MSSRVSSADLVTNTRDPARNPPRSRLGGRPRRVIRYLRQVAAMAGRKTGADVKADGTLLSEGDTHVGRNGASVNAGNPPLPGSDESAGGSYGDSG